jgi:ABC-type antimicrobial peptide transport system permease subunit
MLVAEAGFITGLGGFVGLLLGGVLLFTFQNTLVYYLQTVHVEFHWPELNTIGIAAAVCVAATVAIGVIAAALPSWRASAEEPYRLLQAEDARC